MTERTRLNHARGKTFLTKICSWTLDVKNAFWVPGNGYQGGGQVS